MKTNRFLTNSLRRIRTLPLLASLAILSTSLCRAQDASCKVAADAEVLMARTPYHLYSTDVRAGRSTNTESISSAAGIFWKSTGAWHKTGSSMSQIAQETAESVRGLRNCVHAGDEAVNGQPTGKYSVHNSESGTVDVDTEWIAKSSGLVLKAEIVSGATRISNRYDYTNVQPPPNVR